jgi:hypothetical protein
MHRILIAGSRSFEFQYQLIADWMDWLTHEQIGLLPPPSLIVENVSGTAKGPDKHGETWCRRNGISNHFMPADWHPNGKYNKAAGHIRNADMAKYLQDNQVTGQPHGIIFWDGISPGSAGMLKLLDKAKIRTILVQPNRGAHELIHDNGWRTH